MKKYLLGFLKFFFSKSVSKFALVTPDCKISKKAKVCRFSKMYSSNLGDYSYVANGSELTIVNVGKFCSIGRDCKIGLPTHTIQNISTSPVFTEKVNPLGVQWVDETIVEMIKPTNIGSDVWIGSNVMIMDGVNVGDGAVIGAGAIVTKDVPAYAIVGGVPAKVIKYRFSEECVAQLLSSKWWDLPEDKIKEKIKLFQRPANLDEVKSIFED